MRNALYKLKIIIIAVTDDNGFISEGAGGLGSSDKPGCLTPNSIITLSCKEIRYTRCVHFRLSETQINYHIDLWLIVFVRLTTVGLVRQLRAYCMDALNVETKPQFSTIDYTTEMTYQSLC